MQQTRSQTNVIVVPPPQPARALDEVKNERMVLTAQLDGLRREHRDLRVELSRMPEGAERRIRGERIEELDQRILQVEKALEVNRIDMNDAVPVGTHMIEVPPSFSQESGLQQVPDSYVALAALFMLVTFLPLSIALARRMWHRGVAAVAAVPADLLERMNRVENIVEATALEVERIGEGQRFMTAIMNENMGAPRSLSVPPRVASSRERGAQRDALPGAGESPLPGMITPV